MIAAAATATTAAASSPTGADRDSYLLFPIVAIKSADLLPWWELRNAEGKGNIRKEELYRACAVLRDGFNESWDHGLLATIIAEEIKACEIDM
ncbi:hypothetical protein Taro_027563, partial [Colocasia esculenta]|nr:hypothetical protein [Colocasia esculenta]